MPPTTPPHPDAVPPDSPKITDYARVAVFSLFALDGIGFGSWAAYLPSYKTRLGLSDGQLGIVLFALVVGSLVSMPAAGRALSRRSSRSVVLFGSATFSLTIPLVAFVAMTIGSMPLFVLAALLFGATKGIIDVSANAHAICVEREGRKQLLSTCHGGWSLGVLCGASAIALALKLGTPPLLATTMIALALLGITGLAARWLADVGRDEIRERSGTTSIRPRGRLIPLAALAFVGLFCEGSMGDWATIFLTESVHATPSAAAMGFATYSFVMMFGRFFGDRLVDRLGPVTLFAASGLGVAVGLGVALAFRTYPATLVGFSVMGLAVANMVPILFRAAGRNRDSGAAIASVSTVGYLGFLAGPPLIGALSQSFGLPAALSVVVLSGLIVAAGARFVGDHSDPEIQPSLKNTDESIPHVQVEPTV